MSTARLVWGTGVSSTKIAAFDTALAEAGIHNYNLITLSSMLPPDATLKEEGRATQENNTGTILPVVMADVRTQEQANITAGIGWQQAKQGSILVEHTATENKRKDSIGTCKKLIEESLRNTRLNRPEWTDWSKPNNKTVTIESDGHPTAAVVAITLPNAPIR